MLGAGQRGGDHGNHRVRRVDELSPGEAQHRVAVEMEVGVAGAVLLERLTRAVEGEAVDLHDEPLLGPQGVDLVAVNKLVGPWSLQPGVLDEPEERPLRLGSGARGG